MRLAALVRLVSRDLRRARSALLTSGFGIAAGTAALVFFLALGLGVRGVLLGDVFPIDQVELEPPKAGDPGLIGLLVGAGEAPGIPPADVDALRGVPGVRGVFPKLRLSFPASARGGKAIFGHDLAAGEMIADGIDPALVRADLEQPESFADPLLEPGPVCQADDACTAPQYCERAAGAAEGRCSDPIPAVVSRYVVELFDKSIAPAHGLPAIGGTLVARAQGMVFDLRLGESLLGRAKAGTPRTVRARVVGVSRRAIDLGLTLPLDVVRRYNSEFTGDRAASERYSSVVVEARGAAATGEVLAKGATLRLTPRDTRARDVSVLLTSVTALLSLVAGVILVVSASNIAYTFRVLVTERRAELSLYRALGATASDVRAFVLTLAATVGVAGGAVGLVVARLAALGTDRFAASGLPDFPFKPESFFAFSPLLLLGGLSFAALFALLGAWGAAGAASRAEPAHALAGS